MTKNEINVLGFNVKRKSIENVVKKLNETEDERGYVVYKFKEGKLVYYKRWHSSSDVGECYYMSIRKLKKLNCMCSFEDVVSKLTKGLWESVYRTTKDNANYECMREVLKHFEDEPIRKFNISLEYECYQGSTLKRYQIYNIHNYKMAVKTSSEAVGRVFPYTRRWLYAALSDMMRSMSILEMCVENFDASGFRLSDPDKFENVKNKVNAVINLLEVNNLDLIPIILKENEA